VAGLGEFLWDAWVSEGPGQDRRASVACFIYGDGRGRHMLPVKAEIREVIGKDVGGVVMVNLEGRIGPAKPSSKRSKYS
jgi:hypothetical protein